MQIPRFWRLKDERYRLQGSNCQECGEVHFPPKPVCPDCGAGGAHKTETVNSTSPAPEGSAVNVGGKERGG